MSTTSIDRTDDVQVTTADRTRAAGPEPGGEQLARELVAVPTAGRRIGPRRGDQHLRMVREAGMATAEYAVALIAACAFAAVLLAAIRTGAVMSAIGRLITTALKVIS